MSISVLFIMYTDTAVLLNNTSAGQRITNFQFELTSTSAEMYSATATEKMNYLNVTNSRLGKYC